MYEISTSLNMCPTYCLRRLFITFLALFLFGHLAHGKTVRIDAPSKEMTVRQARKALVESLNHMLSIQSVRNVRFKRHQMTFIGEDRAMDHKGNFHDVGIPVDHLIVFAEMTSLALENTAIVRRQGKRLHLGKCLAYFRGTHATTFIDAVLTLRQAALAPDTAETDFTAFTTNAQTWLATADKPEMPDEARAYRVLAEDAFKRKDFVGSLEAYIAALERHQMWPEGHYNAALLAAETEDYELAAQHMKRYLVLAPAANDTTAAKDKLLLWQLKAKE